MTGSLALAGSPEAVQQAGVSLRQSTIGERVHARLSGAALGLGAVPDGAVSTARIRSELQATVAPAHLMQRGDELLGAALIAYGAQLDELSQRARGELQRAAESLIGSPQSPDHAGARPRALALLDEERRSADAVAMRGIREAGDRYLASLSALPSPPRVSAHARVSVVSAQGSEASVSALSLAALRSPRSIRSVWDRMSEAQRSRLIADLPTLIGNLEGIPLRDRNSANRLTAAAHRSELEQQIVALELLQGQPDLAGSLAASIRELRSEVRSIDAMLGDRNDRYARETDSSGQPFGTSRVFGEDGRVATQDGIVIVGYHPLRDSFITFQGALDPDTGDLPRWMKHIGVLVPGTNSRLAGFTSDLARGRELFNATGDRAGYFIWHGAAMPRFSPPTVVGEPALRSFAEVAAPRLAVFVNALRLAPGAEVVPIGHSYGAAVLGGAEFHGLRASRVVYVAPAGIGHSVSGIDEFPHTKDAPHFVLQARNDRVVGWNQGHSGGGLGHGVAHPLNAPGIVRLETGYLTDGEPSSGTIESPGGVASHSTPFATSSTSMRNITSAVRGDPVSLYQENDRERRHVRGRVPRGIEHEIPDSGAAKPEQRISSRTLEPVA